MSDTSSYDIIEGVNNESGKIVFMISARNDFGVPAAEDKDYFKRSSLRALYNHQRKRFCVIDSYSDARCVVDELNRLLDEAEKLQNLVDFYEGRGKE